MISGDEKPSGGQLVINGEEAELKATVNRKRKLRSKYGEAWDLIDSAMMTYRNFYEDYLFIEADAVV